MIIEFGDWQLRPMDDRNWELYHRHVTSRGKDRGAAKWHACEKYYQYNTIDNAILYAADADMKRATGTFDPSSFLAEYRRVLAEFAEAVSEALRNPNSPAS